VATDPRKAERLVGTADQSRACLTSAVYGAKIGKPIIAHLARAWTR